MERFIEEVGRAVGLDSRQEGSPIVDPRGVLGLGTLVRILALAYLGYVGFDSREIVRQIVLNHRLLRDGHLEKMRHFFDDLIEVDRLDNKPAFAGIRQHLAA